MRPYIHGVRDGVHIIDLTLTLRALHESCSVLTEAARNRLNILFVGTKPAASAAVEYEARRCGVVYVNQRWLGGTITNFDSVRGRINRMRSLEEERDSGEFFRRPKLEQSRLLREYVRLERRFGGMKGMHGRPDVLVIVDPRRESIAVSEAVKAGVPVIALVDTNCDPSGIDIVIPGNDDSRRAVGILLAGIADAIIAGRGNDDLQGAPVPINRGPDTPYTVLAISMLAEEDEEKE